METDELINKYTEITKRKVYSVEDIDEILSDLFNLMINEIIDLKNRVEELENG